MNLLKSFAYPFIYGLVFLFSYFLFTQNALAVWDNSHSTDLNASSNQYWSITDASQTGLDITGDMTISMWVKLDTSAEKQLLSKWNHVTQTSYLLTTTGTNVQLYLNSSGSGYGYSSVMKAHGKSLGEWFNLAVVYKSASGTAEFFVDGTSIGSGSGLPTSISNTGAPFIIGAYANLNYFFDGSVDDVRIWSRTLSSAEVQELYVDPEDFSNGTDLQGWWKFNNDGTDSSGNNNTLTNNNSASFQTETANRQSGNYSLDLNGQSSVGIADVDQTGLDITGDMTISAWIKLDTTAEQSLVSKWHHVSDTSYRLTTTGTNLELYLSSTGSGFGYSSVMKAHGQSVGDWFNLVVIYNSASGTAEFFVDGTSIGSGSGLPTSIADTDSSFRIGSYDNSSINFDGAIDEVRIWSRALSPTEVDDLFDYPILFDNGSDLEGYWKFNNNYNDASGNGNHFDPDFSSTTAY